MALMIGCGLAVLMAVVAVVGWGGIEMATPARHEPVAKRYAWAVTVALVGGLGAGFLVAGAGGRLVMRLLAATAGEGAQGRITEAEEIVGRISVGGTIGFVLFVGAFAGLITGGLFLLLHRWLPAGRWGGAAFGVILLVVGATRFEPLRGDNRDFDIVGPSWLSLLAFGALVVLHGMAVAAVAARYAQHQPLIAPARRALLRHAPLLLLAPLVFPAAVVLLGLVVCVVADATSLSARMRSPRALAVGRGLVLATVLVALPGFVSTVADIAGRGP